MTDLQAVIAPAAAPGSLRLRGTGSGKGRVRRARANRSPSRANWWRNPPAPSPPSRSATACFTIKFGNGNVVAVDGNKLTIQFDKAGEKRVVDSFVERV